MLKEGFLWGGAVTAHQSEGGHTMYGKVSAVCDNICQPEFGDFKDGIDEIHRYEEDFALFEECGFTCYRFSIDWSRVSPDGIHFNEEALEYYDRFIDALIAYGMEPMCSLYHFEMPQVLMDEYNGFYSRKVVDMFVNYAYKMIDRYGDRVKKWISFNEQNGIAFINDEKFLYGAKCPEGVDFQTFVNQLIHNTFVAHALVAKKVHTIKDAQILGMIIYAPVQAKTCDPRDVRAAMDHNAITEQYLYMFTHGEYLPYIYQKMIKEDKLPKMEAGDLQLLKENTVDMLSLSYYFSHAYSAQEGECNNPYLKESEWGWPIDPTGLYLGLRDIYDRYRLPIMVVENGLGAKDILENGTVYDDYRIDYMRAHIQAVKEAVSDGVDCRGYLMWGPIDILSSHGEMAKRYGIIYVNREDHDLKDMKRYKKKSFTWYQKVIASNGEKL